MGLARGPVPNPTLYAPDETLGIGLSMAGRGGDGVDLSLTAPDGTVDAWTWTVTGYSVGGVHRFAGLWTQQ